MTTNQAVVTIVAMACITILEIIAMINHIDGMALTSGAMAIAGLGGYQLAKKKAS